MSDLPDCPKCGSEYTYEDGSMYVCPECAQEWAIDAEVDSTDNKRVIHDANGNPLEDGDTVTVIKDLKVKGSSLVVKVGTKVKLPHGYIEQQILFAVGPVTVEHIRTNRLVRDLCDPVLLPVLVISHCNRYPLETAQ